MGADASMLFQRALSQPPFLEVSKSEADYVSGLYYARGNKVQQDSESYNAFVAFFVLIKCFPIITQD